MVKKTIAVLTVLMMAACAFATDYKKAFDNIIKQQDKIATLLDNYYDEVRGLWGKVQQEGKTKATIKAYNKVQKHREAIGDEILKGIDMFDLLDNENDKYYINLGYGDRLETLANKMSNLDQKVNSIKVYNEVLDDIFETND